MGSPLIYLVHIFFIFFFAWLFFKYAGYSLRKAYWPAILIKFACGIFYGVLYFYYFKGGDTVNYFKQASILAELARTDFFSYMEAILFDKNIESINLIYSSVKNPRALWFCKFASSILWATSSNYWLTGIYCSLFSFMGTYFLAETLVKLYPRHRIEIAISFFFFPSFIFWSSGFTKESVAIAALFFLIACAIKISNRIPVSFIQMALLFCCLYILYKVRVFYLAVYLITFGTYAFLSVIERWLSIKKLVFVAIGVLSTLLIILISTQLDYTLNLSHITEYVYLSYKDNYESNPNNSLKLINYKPSYVSFLMNAPLALVSGLFRPSLLDVVKPVMLLVALENLLLLAFFFCKIRTFKTENVLYWVMWTYIALLATFLTLSTANFGTLTRYKVAVYPFLLFVLLKNELFSGLKKHLTRKTGVGLKTNKSS